MANEELIAYVKARQEQGVGREEITNELKSTGWGENDIAETFGAMEFSAPVPLHDVPPPPAAGIETVAKASYASLLSAGDTIRQAFALYKSRIGTLLGIMLFPTVLSLAMALVPLFVPSFSRMVYGNVLYMAGIFVVIVLSIIVSSVAQISVLYSLHENTSVSASYGKAFSKLLSYWWISILSGLIIVAGFFLLIIPGIIFSLWFTFSSLILIVEGKKGIDALMKSREYVRGYWWNIFGRFFILGLVTLGVFIVPAIFLFVVATLLHLDTKAIQEVFQIIAQFFITPFSLVVLYTIYTNLRAVKEASGEMLVKGKRRNYGLLIVLGLLGVVLIPILVLSVIVLPSLNNARTRGNDAAIKANLNVIRAQSELIYDEVGNYNPVCGANFAEQDTTIRSYIQSAKKNNGEGDVVCGKPVSGDATAYAISSSLATDSSQYYCIDSTGYAGLSYIRLQENETMCPKSDPYDTDIYR